MLSKITTKREHHVNDFIFLSIKDLKARGIIHCKTHLAVSREGQQNQSKLRASFHTNKCGKALQPGKCDWGKKR